MPQDFRRFGSSGRSRILRDIALLPWNAQAQVLYGSILGSVTDAAGRFRARGAGSHYERRDAPNSRDHNGRRRQLRVSLDPRRLL